MRQLRALLLRHRTFAILAVVAALCMKLAMPAGFMIEPNSKVLTVQICADASGGQLVKKIVIPMKEGTGDTGSKHGKPSPGECPFGSLSMASNTGADPALLGLALAFILSLAFAPVRPAPLQRLSYLRPPLRGPPALA